MIKSKWRTTFLIASTAQAVVFLRLRRAIGIPTLNMGRPPEHVMSVHRSPADLPVARPAFCPGRALAFIQRVDGSGSINRRDDSPAFRVW